MPAAISTPTTMQVVSGSGTMVAITHEGRSVRSHPGGHMYWVPVRRARYWPGAAYWYAIGIGANEEFYERGVERLGGDSAVYQWQTDEPRTGDLPALQTAAQLPGPVRRSVPQLRAHRCAILAGWPFRSAIGYHDFMLSVSNSIPTSEDTITLPQIAGFQAVIPVRPLWPGLFGNWAFHSLAVFVVLAVAPIARGAWRGRRGLCPSCGYDRRGLVDASPCPECGAGRGMLAINGPNPT
ncbi:MAG: hypothetical protein ACIAS6_09405 [Phycisphaerales bacterium JB060]